MSRDRRFGIVVGTNNYKDKKLQYSLKDAEDVSAILLERCNFLKEDIITICSKEGETNVHQEIKNSFQTIKDSGFLKKTHSFFFYYSGHGSYDNKLEESFLNLSDSENIAIQEIWDEIVVLDAKNSYLIIDACYSGANLILEGSKSKTERTLHFHSEGVYCIFASSKNDQAYEPNEIQSLKQNIANGYLTNFFLQALKNRENYTDSFISIKAIDDFISLKTQTNTNFIQVPVSNGLIKGYYPFGFWNEENSITSNQKSKEEISKTEIEFNSKGKLFTGKEVVLINSNREEFDFEVHELVRFNEDCSKKYKFEEDDLFLDEKTKIKVLVRSSSLSGMFRFLEDQESKFKSATIGFSESLEDKEEYSDCSINHRALLQEKLKSNLDINYCLHCGLFANTNNVYFVELDSIEYDSNIGIIHKNCRRTSDRLLGTRIIEDIESPISLDNFDILEWAKKIMYGQAYLRGIKRIKQFAILSWYPDPIIKINDEYCLRYIVEDGSYLYDKRYDLNINKFKKRKAEEWAKNLRSHYKERKAAGDPECITSIKKRGGSYSQLLKYKEDDEEILEIVDVKAVRYSKQFESDIAKEMTNAFAPLCTLVDKNDKTPIILGKVVPLISNPESIKIYLNNWEKALGYAIDEIEFSIIEDDKSFDMLVGSILHQNLMPVIDPLFDLNFRLIRGTGIQSQEALVKDGNKRKQAKEKKVGRNEPCPCGSGKKFKKCHGK